MEFIDNWYRQAKAILTQPKEFFRKMQTTGGFGEPFRFAILNMFLAFVLSWGFMIAIPDMKFQHALQYFGIEIWMFSLIMMPVALVVGSIGLFLFSGINHLFLKLVGAKKSYEATFRVFAYLSVFNILVAVSNVNNLAAKAIGFIISLYVLYVMIAALKEVHEISFLRSAIAVLLPIVITIIIVVIIVAILVTLVFMGSMGGIAQTDPNLLPMQAKAIAGLLK